MDRNDDLVSALFRGMSGGAKLYGAHMASHMPVLYILAQKWSFSDVVEIGVGRGWSTTALLAGAMSSGRKLISYDVNPETRTWALNSMGLKKEDPRLVLWDFRLKKSLDAPSDFRDQVISLWFLDTTHTYRDTKAEIDAWLPKIHPRGVMCGHDYYLHEHPEWKNVSGVNRAVEEFAKAQADRFTLQVLPHDMGFFILWPKKVD